MIQLTKNVMIYSKTGCSDVTNELKFLTILMHNGRKDSLLKTLLNVNFYIKKKYGMSMRLIINYIIMNYSTSIRLKRLKLAGNTYTIPSEINELQKRNLTIKKLKNVLLENPKNGLLSKLLLEISQILLGNTQLKKEKEGLCKKAESGSAYLFYKW